MYRGVVAVQYIPSQVDGMDEQSPSFVLFVVVFPAVDAGVEAVQWRSIVWCNLAEMNV